MWGTVVVGTDGSETAGRALDEAIRIASAGNSSLHIVTAYRPLGPVEVERRRAGLPPARRGEVDEGHDARLLLARAAAAAEAAGVRAETWGLPGDAAEALLEVVEKVSADLLVIGNRGLGSVSRFLLGSVPGKVAHHCPCHLLIVHTT